MKWFQNEDTNNWEYVNEQEELLGYVDILYTTIGKTKYLAGFCFAKGKEKQDELTDYAESIEEGKEYVEAQYMAYRMIGPFTDDDKGRD